MVNRGVRYVVNEKGEKESVVLPVSMFEKIVEELEDLEDAQIVEERMKDPDWVDWDRAKQELGL
jgi:PHD/YefM family antitoxin component YafN of YafNO toxin-antitoxin module